MTNWPWNRFWNHNNVCATALFIYLHTAGINTRVETLHNDILSVTALFDCIHSISVWELKTLELQSQQCESGNSPETIAFWVRQYSIRTQCINLRLGQSLHHIHIRVQTQSEMIHNISLWVWKLSWNHCNKCGSTLKLQSYQNENGKPLQINLSWNSLPKYDTLRATVLLTHSKGAWHPTSKM